MARGVDGKLRRRATKKSARDNANNPANNSDDNNQTNETYGEEKTHQQTNEESSSESESGESDNEDNQLDDEEIRRKVSEAKRERKLEKLKAKMQAKQPGYFSNIKPLPLLFLFLLTIGSLLPSLLWLSSNLSPLLSKYKITQTFGYNINLGPIPRSQIISFYEKHSPDKLGDVESTLKKYYGDYKVMTRKLERKYGDYGYFLHWEDEVTSLKKFNEVFEGYKKSAMTYYQKNAPPAVVQGVTNIQVNVGGLYKKGTKLWKQRIWPVLRPYIGTPTAAEIKNQKARDKKAYGRKVKGVNKKNKFRDEEDDNEFEEANLEDLY